MSSPRFHILEFSPMAVRDTYTETNIHLGSQYEAKEMCRLLNELQDTSVEAKAKLQEEEIKLKQQGMTILKLSGKIQDLQKELKHIRDVAEFNKFNL